MTGCTPYGVAHTLLALMVAELADTAAGVPAIRAVEPKPVATMEDCDQAWTSVATVGPFGEDADVSRCALQYLVTIHAGVYRCYPTADQNARPAEALINSAVRDKLDDMEAMRRAIVKLAEDPYIGAVNIGAWTPLGPLGARHGGYWRVPVVMDLGQFSSAVVPRQPGDPHAAG
ncbi:hypothetical protein SEA_LILBEANIE_23 [Gordonia phage Lilbeanie]|uniref:Uncharacterized protein n=1 Tax=Gordonia phage Lilbeanie TaxID=2794947 RepID=A0A7T1KS86_9CAUD|nr:hypothetical protein J1773_gp23 [Gordonia phage Lilbeanie]QPO17101.1 hypothetical protein SEA_LILBEANIE_23 [Gordonia phage Lilbeanie]